MSMEMWCVCMKRGGQLDSMVVMGSTLEGNHLFTGVVSVNSA